MASLTIITILISIISFSNSISAGNDTDKLSLLEFKAKIEGDPLGLLHSWNETVPFCSWPGVTCSRLHSHRVTALDVSKWRLKGHLSPHIGNLSFLRRLSLANNEFSPEIPGEIGRLVRLQVLDLRNNSFFGEIPKNISSCSRLRILRLLANNLTGMIPEELGLLPELRTMDLGKNNLGGKIPASIGNLTSVVKLSLRSNSLEGTIPSSLGRLKNLKIVSLGTNSLTGTIPLSLYNISTIQYFAVNHNQLEGNLPSNLGHTLPNLQQLLLNNNNFSGPIPASMSNASNLILFQIPSNTFTGKVPSFTSSSNLQRLGIFNNNLGFAKNGDLDFLRDLVNSTSLEVLHIDNNNLGGSIPETIGNMSSTTLWTMAFGRNQISGNIPPGIGNLVGLKILGLEENYLTGPIPSSIGKLENMNVLTLDDNELSGTIPSTLNNLTLLSILTMAANNIGGNIPKSLGECRNLKALSLAENNLSGPIPSQVIGLSSLSMSVDLSTNHLSGSIPTEIGKLVNLGYMDISENELSGEIPDALGNCVSMEYLYLQGNFLQGSIPESLDSLMGVQVLDLSRNNLSGQIPMYLARFRGLLYLNLSFNGFEGEVPRQGVFINASGFSARGNTRLCGGIAELKLITCTTNAQKRHKLSQSTKFIIIIGCAVTGMFIISLLAIHSLSSRKRSKAISEETSCGGSSFQRVSYGDLSKATDGFSSANLIGVGGFGSVYKGILNEEEILVAVKVLNLDVSRALKSFAAECETLRMLRHRNLIKLLTICSSIDFQGNDFKALVYEFMQNGNLEQWLHSGQEESRRLNLVQRINIAIDVASALEYLHNHGPEPILHCDIKPSNILLDGQLVAHVGDFGLAKLLKNVYTSSDQSNTIGVRGTVGYVAPEYSMGSEVSTFSDVYSFGILLMEMFTAKRPTDNMFEDDFNLHNYASAALPERINEIVDPILLDDEENRATRNDRYRSDNQCQIVHRSLISIMEIGVVCSSTFPRERLSISSVVVELRRIKNMLVGRKMPRNHAINVQG